MTNLKIQQENNIEIVNANIISKLYEIALSIPEPLSGEEDDMYLSGHIFSERAVEDEVKYLAGVVSYKGVITLNPTGRFLDLLIDVTDYYLPFVDTVFKKYALSLGADLILDGITQLDVNRFLYDLGNTYDSDRGFFKYGSNTYDHNFPSYSPSITSLDDLKYFEQVPYFEFNCKSGTTSNLTSITLPYTLEKFTLRNVDRFPNLKRLIITPHKYTSGLSSYIVDIPDSNRRQNFEYFDLGDTDVLNTGITTHVNLQGFHINSKGHTIIVKCLFAPNLIFQDLIDGGLDEDNWMFLDNYNYDGGFSNCESLERLPMNNLNTTFPQKCYFNCINATGYHILPSTLVSFNGGGSHFALCRALNGIVFTNTIPPVSDPTTASHHFANNGEWSNPNITAGFKILVPNSVISDFLNCDIMNKTYRNGSIPKNYIHGYTLWFYNAGWQEVLPLNNKVDFNKAKNASLNNRVLQSTIGSEQSILSGISDPVDGETCAILYY